jgi:uncharacterized membrane protein YesL
MNFFSIDSPLFRFLDKFALVLFLNFVWFITCIPIITIFPATAAMFGVVRKWAMKEDVRVLRCFLSCFKENLKQGILIGLIWFLVAFVLFFNFSLSFQLPEGMKTITIGVISLFIFLFLCTSIYLFPIMANYKTTWKSVIRNSFLMSVNQMPKTILGILCLLITVTVIFFVPVSMFLMWSLTAYAIYHLCEKSFQNIEEIKRG